MDIPRLLTQSKPPDPGKSSARLFARRSLFALAAIALAFVLKDVWLLGFFAVILAVVLSYPVGLLSRWMPRGAATLLTFALGMGALYFITPLFATPFIEQAKQAELRLPDAFEKAKRWLRYNQQSTGGAAAVIPGKADIAKGMEQKTKGIATSIVENLGQALVKASSFGATIVLVIALSLFYVYEPDIYRRYLLALVPPEHEPAFNILWSRMGIGLRRWVGGILVSMVLMGTFTAIGLRLAGVQNWLLLGALTFLGTFVPYVGAIASAVPGLLVSLAQSTETFMLACLVYLGVHLVEGYIVEPFVMKRAATIHPAVLLLWQLTMGLLFGIPGTVVATPLYVCLKHALDFLYVERVLGKEPYPIQPLENHHAEDALFEKKEEAS